MAFRPYDNSFESVLPLNAFIYSKSFSTAFLVTCRGDLYFPAFSTDICLTKHVCIKCASELINISFLYSQQKEMVYNEKVDV